MRIRRFAATTSFAAILCSSTAFAEIECDDNGAPVIDDPPPVGNLLSYTRLLRRMQLTLLGEPPSYEQYQEMLDAPDDAAREALIEQTIDDALASPRFYRQMVDYGHDFLRVSAYNFGGSNETNWVGGQAVDHAAASTSQMAQFETEVLTQPRNLTALMTLPGQWIDRVRQAKPIQKLILDLDRSVSET